MTQKKSDLNLIAFSGKRGTGKTTAAIYLKHEYDYKIVSFATPLKEMAEQMFPGITRAAKEKPFKKYSWTPREFYISLGGLLRYYDPDYWIKALKLEDMTGNVVIDDLRFKNEAAYLKTLGSKIVRIERYEHLNIFGKNLDDPSETDLDGYNGFDHTIEACRNVKIDDLTNQVDYAIKSLGMERSS